MLHILVLLYGTILGTIMDGIGNEVTQKIRAAIKSKLVELSAYVDDELPDYIMVMIANKKSREQMTQDLSLFLGDSTENFTGWLQQVLNQLQNIASEPKQKPKESKAKDTEEERPVPPPEVAAPAPTVALSAVPALVEPRSEPDDEVLALKADTEADDDFREDLRCSSVDQPVTKQSIPLIRPFPRVAAPESEQPKARSVSAKVPASKRSGVPSSTVGAVVRRKPQFISDDEDEEYDPNNPSVGSVASIVKVSERRSSVPENMQANRLLVIKAMKDAHASVTSTAKKNPSRVEPYEPTPISKQTTVKKKRPAEVSLPENREDDCTPPKRPALGSIKDRLKMPPVASSASAVVQKEPCNVAVVKSIPVLEENIEEDSDLLEIGVQREDVHTVVKDTLPSAHGRSVTDATRNEVESTREESWPHFVVTLNGVDPNNFKVGSRDVVSTGGQDLDELPLDADDELLLEEDDYIPEEEEEVATGDIQVAEEPMEHTETGVEKVKEKCRYWPACKNGDQCPYHHPTVPCKAFPNCKYKEKCLFIHPNCKYDAFCKRRDCPYTHASRRNFSCPPPVASSPSLKHCRFYPHCTNTKCSYFHPKLIYQFVDAFCLANLGQCVRPPPVLIPMNNIYHPRISSSGLPQHPRRPSVQPHDCPVLHWCP
ncbi:zinc finger CCCH domain-containing protein 14-like isoform X2 [Ornithodoros turicata]|uniref:zinc finger CCCH domain-containing protein 14-like isoform X2 n=1 Tax=Ornithodoros turicata TaxID=34597 RepID=UPI003139B6BE